MLLLLVLCCCCTTHTHTNVKKYQPKLLRALSFRLEPFRDCSRPGLSPRCLWQASGFDVVSCLLTLSAHGAGREEGERATAGPTPREPLPILSSSSRSARCAWGQPRKKGKGRREAGEGSHPLLPWRRFCAGPAPRPAPYFQRGNGRKQRPCCSRDLSAGGAGSCARTLPASPLLYQEKEGWASELALPWDSLSHTHTFQYTGLISSHVVPHSLLKEQAQYGRETLSYPKQLPSLRPFPRGCCNWKLGPSFLLASPSSGLEQHRIGGVEKQSPLRTHQ